MTTTLPPLNALRAFHGAARLGSFAQAAAELNVSPAAVSHQIKQLEHWLGVVLFERSARGVRLSAVGLDYADRVAGLFDDIVTASAALRARRDHGRVTVRAQYSFTSAWLTARLVEFKREHPQIQVRVLIEPSADSQFRGGADLAIYHQGQWRGDFQQQVLVRGRLRAYVARPRTPRRPPDPLSLPWLCTTPMLRHIAWPTLATWFAQAGLQAQAQAQPQPQPQPWSMQFNMEFATAQACMQGAGVALLLDDLYADAVREGRLTPLPGPALPNPAPYLLLNPKGLSSEANTLRQWLIRRAQALRAPAAP